MTGVNFEFSQIGGFAGWKIRTKVKFIKRFKKDTKENEEYHNIETMLYTIHKILDVMKEHQTLHKDKSNYRYFTCMLFTIFKDLEKKDNMKLPLPYYWYVFGPEIEWVSLDEIINKVGYQVKINGVRGKDMSIERLQEIAEHNEV